jgi:hypothetical protein
MDPFWGDDADPSTLNWYVYAGGAPVDLVDPTGLFLASAMTTLVVFTGIALLAMLNPASASGAEQPIKFSTLLSNHPKETPCAVTDRCAIRMAIALDKSGVSFAGYPGRKRPPCGIVRAQELADWLAGAKRFAGQGKQEKMAGSDWQGRVKGRSGMIFFKDYWKRDSDGRNVTTGDHIDLWTGWKLTTWWSPIRLYVPFMRRTRWYSDLNRSKAVWFWEVK